MTIPIPRIRCLLRLPQTHRRDTMALCFISHGSTPGLGEHMRHFPEAEAESEHHGQDRITAAIMNRNIGILESIFERTVLEPRATDGLSRTPYSASWLSLAETYTTLCCNIAIPLHESTCLTWTPRHDAEQQSIRVMVGHMASASRDVAVRAHSMAVGFARSF